MIRLADYVISFLENIGVRDVFTVTGGGSIFLCDALGQSKKIKYYCCHHEQAAAMAAESYARTKNDLGVSLVTTGPGGTNAITGVAGSWMDSVPHLTISGQVFFNQTIGNSGLRQLGVQEINIIDMVKPMTKYAVMVTDAKTIRYHLEKAIYLAKNGRPGPVWLDIPADVQNSKINPDELSGFNPDEVALKLDSDLKQKVSLLVEKLKASKRPLVHVGQGVKLAHVENEFFKFVEILQLPFVTARNANDLVDSSHPLFVGRPGTFAQRAPNFAVQTCDLYLAIGTRLSMPQTGYNSKDYARNAFRVMVDIDRTELDKRTLFLDLKIHADVRDFFKELNSQLSSLKLDTKNWQKQCAAWKEKYPVVQPEHKTQAIGVNSYYFTDVMSDYLTKDDVVVTDMGMAFQNVHQAIRIKKGQKVFTNCGLASMGWGLPAAVGACVANDFKRTICTAGDGGLLMNLQELATIMHHKMPVKLFIFNNGGYLTIKQTQQLGFNARLMGSTPETGLSFPDFGALAEAHRLPFVRINNTKELADGIQKTLNMPGPTVCEVVMDPDQDQILKSINKRKADGSMSPTPLEDLYPFLPEEEVRKNMAIITE